MTSSGGDVLWQWAYTGNPFGEKAPVSSDSYTLNLRFPGQYFDAESGLNYNVHRDYEAASGRYIQSDPMGVSAGPTTYGYVSGNPLLAWDELGLVRHTTGKTVDCGGGCTIRIDYIFDEATQIKSRHLHWDCKGQEGSCGENGNDSHDGSWDDAPRKIKECALKNGFNGAPAADPDPEPAQRYDAPKPSPWLYPLILVGAGLYYLVSEVL